MQHSLTMARVYCLMKSIFSKFIDWTKKEWLSKCCSFNHVTWFTLNAFTSALIEITIAYLSTFNLCFTLFPVPSLSYGIDLKFRYFLRLYRIIYFTRTEMKKHLVNQTASQSHWKRYERKYKTSDDTDTLTPKTQSQIECCHLCQINIAFY